MSVDNRLVVGVEATPVGQIEPVAIQPGEARARLQWADRLLQNRKATAGAAILLLFLVLAVAAPVIAPGDPGDFVARPHLAPSSEYWFGTTGQGQDVFAQTIWGARSSLGVALVVGTVVTIIGAILGITAGYFGGRVDDILSLATNVVLIIPGFPLLVVLAAFLPPGTATIMLVLILTGWPWGARVLRAQTLSLRERDFVAAAEVTGESRFRIMFREILPNMLSIVVSGMFGATVYTIGAHAGLEFLGLGNPSNVSWGTNLYWAGNNAGLLVGAWWTFVPSGLAIALVAFSLALINYALDEITNPRLRAIRETTLALKTRRVSATKTRATPVLKRAH